MIVPHEILPLPAKLSRVEARPEDLLLKLYVEAYGAAVRRLNEAIQEVARYEAFFGRLGERAPGDGVSVEELLARLGRVVVVDARKPEDIAAFPFRIPGAVRGAPPQGKPVVTYCVYGFEIGRDAAVALRQAGHSARHLAGGIAAWRALGGALEPAEVPPPQPSPGFAKGGGATAGPPLVSP